MAGEKKSVVLPAVGLLALLPGAVTFLFARGEATRLNSDWVKICTPLLLIGAASFVVLLQRKLGNAGLGVGAAIAVGALGFAYFDLNRTVVERARWQASSRELSDMERFCRGKVQGNPNARAYTAGAKNPAVFFGPSRLNLYEAKYNPFEPAEHQIEQASMVVCVTEQTLEVEKCGGYTNGGVVTRTRVDQALQVFAIQSGALLLEKSFPGYAPRACASTEKFYGKSNTAGITGEAVKIDLIAELGPLLVK